MITKTHGVWMYGLDQALSVSRVIATDVMIAMNIDPSKFRVRDEIIAAIQKRVTEVLDEVANSQINRNELAGRAMQALLSAETSQLICDRDPRYKGDNFAEVLALNAYEFADEMIKASKVKS